MIGRTLALAVIAGCNFAASTSSTRPRVVSSAADSSSTRGPATATQAPEIAGDEPIPAGAIRETGYAQDRRHFYLPAPDRPTDPWAGVAGSKPVSIEMDTFWWSSRRESFACTAARDHCLPAVSWMWFPEAKLNMQGVSAKPIVFTQEGARRPNNLMQLPAEAFVAFRTVPATRKALVAGARIFVQPGKPVPEEPWDDWHVGTIDRVDWDMGFVYLTTAEEPYWITGARVPVLVWDATNGVKILDGKPRDALAVDARDVLLP